MTGGLILIPVEHRTLFHNGKNPTNMTYIHFHTMTESSIWQKRAHYVERAVLAPFAWLYVLEGMHRQMSSIFWNWDCHFKIKSLTGMTMHLSIIKIKKNKKCIYRKMNTHTPCDEEKSKQIFAGCYYN